MPSTRLFVAGLAAGLVLAAPAGAEEDVAYEYIGVKKCSMCHKKDATGNQLAKWQEGPHAGAWETLASEKALAEAAKHGIDNPQQAPECLKCHATAFAVMDDLANQKIQLEDGVACESCHGPGSGYYKKKTMQAITDGEIEAASVGLTLPDESVCRQCHTPEGNAFFKEFDFEKMFAKIAHPRPEASEEASAEEEEAEE